MHIPAAAQLSPPPLQPSSSRPALPAPCQELPQPVAGCAAPASSQPRCGFSERTGDCVLLLLPKGCETILNPAQGVLEEADPGCSSHFGGHRTCLQQDPQGRWQLEQERGWSSSLPLLFQEPLHWAPGLPGQGPPHRGTKSFHSLPAHSSAVLWGQGSSVKMLPAGLPYSWHPLSPPHSHPNTFPPPFPPLPCSPGQIMQNVIHPKGKHSWGRMKHRGALWARAEHPEAPLRLLHLMECSKTGSDIHKLKTNKSCLQPGFVHPQTWGREPWTNSNPSTAPRCCLSQPLDMSCRWSQLTPK